jgi:hypothetical protein
MAVSMLLAQSAKCRVPVSVHWISMIPGIA